MSINHGDFFRLLDRALEGYAYETTVDSATIHLKPGIVHIHLHPQTEHRIASLVLPSTVVEFTIENVPEAEREAFFEKFELSFRRGGG